MTREPDLDDLAHHERETAAHESFLSGLVDDDEAELFGCLYIAPPDRAGDADTEVSWWVVDPLVGTDVERAFDAFVPQWLGERWPLRRPRYVGHDLSWADRNALPRRS